MSENTNPRITTAEATANLRATIDAMVAEGNIVPATISAALRSVPAAARGPIGAEILRDLLTGPSATYAAEVAGALAAPTTDTATRRTVAGWPEATAMGNVADRYAVLISVHAALDNIAAEVAEALNMAPADIYAVAADVNPATVEKMVDRILRGLPRPTGTGGTRTAIATTFTEVADAYNLRGAVLYGPGDRGAVAMVDEADRDGVHYATVVVEGHEEPFSSLSAAAAVIAGNSVNGWGWFAIDREGEGRISLADLRAAVTVDTDEITTADDAEVTASEDGDTASE